MSVDLASLASLALVAVEWFAVGSLSAIAWPALDWWPPRVALRLLVGATFLATAQLVLAAIGVGFTVVPLVLLLAVVLALVFRVNMRPGRGQSRAANPWIETPERAAWIVLGLVLAAGLVRALVVPEGGWDAFSHWGLRAQAYATAGTVTNAGSEHEYYPPLVPLLEAWLYLHLGQPSIDIGKTVWALVGGAFAVCLSWHLRLLLRPTYLGPIAGLGILLVTPTLIEGFWTGQADLPLTAFFTLAILATWQYLRTSERQWLAQTVVFSFATGLTKLEGTPRILVAALVVLVACRRPRLALALAIPALAATALWTLVAARSGISPNAEHLGAFQPLAIGAVLVALVQTFGGVRTGGGLLVVVLAWALAWKDLPRLLVLVVLAELAFTLAAFLFSDIRPDIEVRTSATRLFEQFLPLALVAAAVGLRKAHP